MKKQRLLRALVVLAPALFGPLSYADDEVPDTQSADYTDVVRALSELGAVEVDPQGRRLQVWKLLEIEPEKLLRVGGQFFVVEADTGRVFSGWQESPTTLEFGIWDDPSTFAPALAVPPLPEAPDGMVLREVWTPPVQGVRVTADRSGRWVYVLGLQGGIWRYDTRNGETYELLRTRDYLGDAEVLPVVQGFCFDAQGRLYVVSNVQDKEARPRVNHVTIWRTDPVEHGAEGRPRPRSWFRTHYPYGINQFNHGVGNIAQGPDGMIYVGSGSRTDSNEDSHDDRIADGGETEITACLWRLDPEEDEPTLDIHARGLRNAFGFAWDGDGALWATDNGPNADPPGELNRVEAGKHYGFPFVFSDWQEAPYPHTPVAPEGLEFVPPVMNTGPDGGGAPDAPIGTFDAHSSPNGIAWLGDAFGPGLTGHLAVARFGNQIPGKVVGYDLLLVKVTEHDGRLTADVHRLLGGLARPLDLHATADGRLLILEHSRQTPGGPDSWMTGLASGRLLELTVEADAQASGEAK